MELDLTPIVEEFSNLQLTSNFKKCKDDFDVMRRSLDVHSHQLDVPRSEINVKSKLFKDSESCEVQEPMTDLKVLRETYLKQIGNEGLLAMKASKRKNETKNETYSLSLITAIS